LNTVAGAVLKSLTVLAPLTTFKNPPETVAVSGTGARKVSVSAPLNVIELLSNAEDNPTLNNQ